jgi:predicted SnoaL-like aldol condensation-catalyzing enzyme
MKRLIFSTAILSLAISCNNPSSTTTTNGDANTQEEKNITNSKKAYTAIETGNTSSLDSLVANDMVDHDGPGGTEVKGKDSVLHMLADIHNHIKNIKFDVISSAANGNYVFNLVHVTGTADSSMGMPGMSVDEKGVDVLKLNSDNKVVDHWGFTEDNVTAKQMMQMRDNMKPQDQSKMKK